MIVQNSEFLKITHNFQRQKFGSYIFGTKRSVNQKVGVYSLNRILKILLYMAANSSTLLTIKFKIKTVEKEGFFSWESCGV